MSESRTELADRFIALANSLAKEGRAPEDVGAAFMYAAARYAAFVTLLYEERSATPREQQVKLLVEGFQNDLNLHLEQRPISRPASPGRDTG